MLKQLIADIEAEKYGIAFRLLRQHKIDINLIYDVNPSKFLTNISKFVSEVRQVDYLNLFINSLNEEERGKELEFMRPQKEEQLIRAQHEEFMQTEINGVAADTTATFTKINKICDAVKEELVKINTDNKYLLPILTTYIKKQP
jgi:elongator complex protein 1